MEHLEKFLEEDIGYGDITTDILVPDIDGKADIVCQDDAVIAGIDEAVAIFEEYAAECEPCVCDGDRVKKGTIVMTVSGPLRNIITLERTVLNIMMRMSGIATATNDVLVMCRRHNKNIRIAGTRKTTPGFRAFEKKAIMLGGGDPHRYRLDDMVLVKDNHIKAAGGMRNVIDLLKAASFTKKVEIEVENVDDAVTAARGGADIIMIDNASPAKAKEIADAVRKVNDITIEVSGNITKENAADYAKVADVISMGSLTHSVRAIHFSLNIR
ncbi:MAG: carboxylating nicotinate-nucleotide diphosphorylase [Methanomassiliicoccaceae archaeon]|jgi:nicotinate-nucleotide pyrophosphorylase (carboxylating)|nr:carboxylating nicotinate-nucleotide diphosphorylase [Methanomassiliicoccaceae archaeon]